MQPIEVMILADSDSTEQKDFRYPAWSLLMDIFIAHDFSRGTKKRTNFKNDFNRLGDASNKDQYPSSNKKVFLQNR